MSVISISRLRGRFLCVLWGQTNLHGYPAMSVEIHQLRTGLQTFCDALVGTWYTQDLRRSPGIVSRQDLRCITLPVLLSFKWGWEKCLPSWLSGPPLSFHVLLLSLLLSTDAPPYSSLPLVPHGSFSSLPPVFHSSGSVLLCLCPSLTLQLCPYDSHSLALPSAPLSLPTPPTRQPGLCCYLCRREPRWAFSHHKLLWPVPQLVCKHCAPCR